jgi:hypothetical protein
MAANDLPAVWAVLLRAYPYFEKERNKRDLAETFEVYASVLSDIPAELLRAAALQHIASSKFFPAVSELRDVALSLSRTAERTAMEAWGEVMHWMSRGDLKMLPGGNGYESPRFSDPLTQRVVNAMGWNQLCQSENLMADRAHFLKAYDAYKARERQDAQLLPQVRSLTEVLRARPPRPRLES